jgi:sugar/nucleoside kinase (ribokinase family)
MNDPEVLVIGRNCLDYISVVEKFPEEDKKVSLCFRMVEGGGQGGTASCCIARLGGRVTLLGKLGDDEEGKICIQRLQAFDVDTTGMETVKDGKTPVAYLFVTRNSGKRTIIYEPNDLPKIAADNHLVDLASRAGSILLDPDVTYLGRELRRIKNRINIIYDCERWRDGIEEMMALADFFVPSSDFLNSRELNLKSTSLHRKMVELGQRVQGTLVVTHGEDGVYYLSDKTLFHVAPPKVNVMDTTGAGDNFHGAFALALSRGYDLHAAVCFAVAAASLSCRDYGGRKGLPTLSEATRIAAKLTTVIVEIQA